MKKLIYSILLLALLINFESCTKKETITPINPPGSNITVYDYILGIYSGTHEYSDSNSNGGLITTAKLSISKLADGKYKLQVSNIYKPYSFTIEDGQKFGNIITFGIPQSSYFYQTLYGDFSYSYGGQLVSLYYNLNSKELAYGIEISSNGNFAGYHRGYYEKN